MTLADYDRLLEEQGGGCALCGRRKKNVRLNTDHDHVTGKVRGILCAPCNRFMGVVDKTPGFIERVQRYMGNGKR